MQHKAFSPSCVINQMDIQEVQDDFCNFLMREVLKPGGLFFDPDSEYATDPKFESLCAESIDPFLFIFRAEAQLMLISILCI